MFRRIRILPTNARKFNSTSTRPPFNKDTIFKLTQPPYPEWKYGDGLQPDQDRWRMEGEESRSTWDLATMPPKQVDVYPLLTSAIIPRPIAFVSSLSPDGEHNLAPFSYFSMVGHNPPLLAVSFTLSDRRPKDTRENILATKEFTVSIISEPFVEAANSTSVESPAEVDEWVLSGLTMAASVDVKPPFVRESAISMECELHSSQDIGPPGSSQCTTTLILGYIKRVHVRRSVMHEDGKTIDARKLRPVSRLGGSTYGRVVEGFDLPRVGWKAVREQYGRLVLNKECFENTVNRD
ncbi:hypothetical protein M378DRAFT_75336 [Amanita muscaria Koide BX008]|uniref:Flavin reductase like domain-containing protein n=1 Tax=Amanita muscaria (strain Koide BX008) TaxID=946122 RepID=A0A0C2WWU2_AMAMK|nr:hypothetical protein M378DRAFT_75336 [Amanita muscaria Koide BX008]